MADSRFYIRRKSGLMCSCKIKEKIYKGTILDTSYDGMSIKVNLTEDNIPTREDVVTIWYTTKLKNKDNQETAIECCMRTKSITILNERGRYMLRLGGLIEKTTSSWA